MTTVEVRGTKPTRSAIAAALLLCACKQPAAGLGVFTDGDGDSNGDATTTTTGEPATGTTEDETAGSTSTSGGLLFDVPQDTTGAATGETTGGLPPVFCSVQDMDALPKCQQQGPPNAFEPEVQWSFDGVDGDVDSIVTPLVANLTDDNGDGVIDLCDTPDVLVVGSPNWYIDGRMVLLDGATGALHFQFAEISDWATTPAIGDIDGDGISEIVGSIGNVLAAWEHDGSLKWESAVPINGDAIGLADVDNDGDIEIYFGASLVDHEGNLVFEAPDEVRFYSTTVAVDLDGDDDLELVLGRSAYHHDGDEVFRNPLLKPAHPAVADIDGDGTPEIILANGVCTQESPVCGLSLLDTEGNIIYDYLNPNGDLQWERPPAMHDVDGDGTPEILVSSGITYGAYRPLSGAPVWTSIVADNSGLASGTAFDFLGDGIAEAIYGDESNLYVYDGTGETLLQTARSSGTLTEYPVVADVDNDGSAEIIVVSNEMAGAQTPMVQVVRDIDDRWIPARRIWNQHAYHVTNVLEDGRIPQIEPRHWELLNTFRTNAQVEGGGLCNPAG